MFADPHSIVALKRGNEQMFISLSSILKGLQIAEEKSVLPPLPKEWRDRVLKNSTAIKNKRVG